MFLARGKSRQSSLSIQKSSFHTSAVQCRYGRQHKGDAKRNFFRPTWRFFLNMENFVKAGMSDDPSFAQGLHRIVMPNYPIADMHIKMRKELRLNSDGWKDKYYRHFPTDRMVYLNRGRPGDKEWYKLPVERFLENLATHLQSGKDDGQAWELALRDKKWEEEARLIEKEVQQQQAELLIGMNESQWNTYDEADVDAHQMAKDPRHEEKHYNDQHQHLQNLVNQRISDPSLRKIKLSDIQMPFIELMDWLSRYPEYKPYFDECIYWGDTPLHVALPKSLPADLRKDEKEAPKADYTVLSDLDFQMSDWAQEMLSLYWDKVDMGAVDDPAEKQHLMDQAYAAKLARESLIQESDVWVERRLDLHYMENDTGFDAPGQSHQDGAAESIKRSLQQQPFIQADLENELTNLFKDVATKS